MTAGELEQVEQKRGPSRGGIGGALIAIGALLLKFAKFLLLPLKLLKFAKFGATMFTMALTIWAYAHIWKLPFAIGFVALIFIHEMGHAGAMKLEGLRAGAPVFIPFLGAFIALKDQPRDVLTEAKIAIAGPLIGGCAAAACLIPWHITGHPMWLGLANIGFFLNLFNLIPFSPLDGGRVVGAISRNFWWIGIALILGAIIIFQAYLLFIILLLGAFQLRANRAKPPGYFDVPTDARIFISLMYFGLLIGLAIAMMLASQHMQVTPHVGVY